MYGKNLCKKLEFSDVHCFHVINPSGQVVCRYSTLECCAQTLSHANGDRTKTDQDAPRKDVSIYAYVLNIKTGERWTRHEAMEVLHKRYLP